MSENIYIAQTAQGSDTGADAANAHSAAWFNTSTNWASPTKVNGKIGPGDTVHLCGTFTPTLGQTALSVQKSGTAGNVITILFETNAKLSAPYWPPTGGAISMYAIQYIVIDGGTNGLIEATDNGTTLNYQQTTSGIWGNGGTQHITVQNLAIRNLYVRSQYGDTMDQNNEDAIRIDDYNGNGNSYWTIDNCVIDHCSTGVWFKGTTTTNITVRNCTISHVNWGMGGGWGSGATGSNFSITNNRIFALDNWDGPTPHYVTGASHSASDAGGISSDTYSITPSGVHPMLLVSVVCSGSDTGMTVTFNGVSLTRKDGQNSASVWYLINPSAVTGNIVITTPSHPIYISSAAAVFSNVKQAEPIFQTPSTDFSGTSRSSTSTSQPSATDNLAIYLAWTDGTLSNGAGLTQRVSTTDHYTARICTSEGAFGTVTGSFTTASNSFLSSYGVSITPYEVNHHDGIITWGYAGASIDGITVAGNTLGPGWGVDTNAGWYHEDHGVTANIYVYNNLILSNAGENPSAGISAGATSGDAICSNNTIVGGSLTLTGRGINFGGLAATTYVQNNVLSNYKSLVSTGSPETGSHWSNNIYYLNNVGGQNFSTYDGAFHLYTWAQWNALGYDVSGSVISTDPLFVGSGDYRLQSGSPARGTGVNLSSVFTTDIDGNTRQTSPTAWDIGAYRYGAAGSPPDAPLIGSATNLAPTSFTANWNSSVGATGYRLDVATDSGFSSFVTGFNNLDVSNVVTYPVTGLSSSTPYYYRVRAYNSDGTSGSSQIATASTTGGTVAGSTPVVSQYRNIGLTLTWTPGSPVTSQIVKWGTAHATYTSSASVSAIETTYTILGLPPSATYYVVVTAVNGANTADSTEASGTTAQAASVSRPRLPVGVGSFW